jgi:N-acetylglucosaminyldiphosphoundecaprenol N-acetyl-beta-D-mannosaminyltransferase
VSAAAASPETGTVNVAGVELHNLSRLELLQRLNDGVFFNPNVDVIMKLRRDPEFFALFHQAEFRICDSRIVELGARFLGTPVEEKISGSDFFGQFCHYHRANPDVRVFLLGAGPGVAEQARRRINDREGREIVVAAHSPSFGFERKPEECAELVERVNASGATVLAVGVGAPKQEKWIMRHRDRMPRVRVFMAVGATIDFEAGVLPRAPEWMQKAGLEWAYRLWREPRRLWRRYLLENTPFLWLLLMQRLGRLPGTPQRNG